jgi:GT2 family glycosyltransferase
MSKIGVGMVTYNSPSRLKQSAFKIPNVDKFVIVNDGTKNEYTTDCYPKSAEVIHHDKNLSVGCAKNTALRYLIQQGCDHLFIIEDDILVENEKVFENYIKAARISGIYHLMFALHGPANVKPDGTKNPRQIIDYGDGVEIGFYPNCVGAFCYFLKGIIKNVGYIDEIYKNAWEHVEHTYKIIKKGLLPGYWWFPDIANSDLYLKEIASSEVNSVIRKTDEWKKNMQMGAEYFKHTHGYYPTTVPDTKPEDILTKLKFIKENYGKKII